MTSETTLLLQRLDSLTSAVCLIAQVYSARINTDQLALRMGVHRNTVRKRSQGKGFPAAGPDGKWALADIIAWEQGKGH